LASTADALLYTFTANVRLPDARFSCLICSSRRRMCRRRFSTRSAFLTKLVTTSPFDFGGNLAPASIAAICRSACVMSERLHPTKDG